MSALTNKELQTLIDYWRGCANSHHFQTYNKGAADGLLTAAQTLEDRMKEKKFMEQEKRRKKKLHGIT